MIAIHSSAFLVVEKNYHSWLLLLLKYALPFVFATRGGVTKLNVFKALFGLSDEA
jgi:hypothetical protein